MRRHMVMLLASILAVMWLALTLAFSDQQTSEPGQQMITARWTETEPVIDGNMSPNEYSAAIPLHVKFNKPTTTPGLVVEGFVYPDDPDDLSFTIYTMYDEACLYIAVDVADDQIVADDGGIVWEDDAVEVFIDGDRINGCPPEDFPYIEFWSNCNPQQGTNDFFNWLMGHPHHRVEGEEGFQLLTSWEGISWNWTSEEFARLDWESQAGLRPRGYLVEFRVALTSIDTEDGNGIVPPAPGDVIGFNVAVDDDDDGGMRDTQGIWDGIEWWGIWGLEDAWGTLYFAPPVPQAPSSVKATETWGKIKAK